jgi:hypothetical protein
LLRPQRVRFNKTGNDTDNVFCLQFAVRGRRIDDPLARSRSFSGQSVNITSKELRFTTTEALLPGQILAASIEWPVRLDNRVRLKLIVTGPVLKRTGDYIYDAYCKV